ncbi:hypothetical protein SFRURICE_011884 [Spodoptera frugiperda]|nr:hypothetical protein SFRURICE_011884 [Spodoptera frugiperda]
MASEPCQVCGCTELKLIDGFYYCVECDTQNTNVRETVIDHKSLGDGTFALSTRKKVKIQDTKIEMSPEWYKWHAYNFIILGLADELVAAGANPSFKLKLLWIWTRYVKKYQNKDDLGLAKTSQEGNDHITLASIMVEENSNNTVNEDDDEGEIEENDEDKPVKPKGLNNIIDGSRRDIKFLSKGVILAMLYLALNLDESDIQLSHLYRFLKEKHLNFSNIQRFVPDDIHVKTLDKLWTNFIHSKIVNVHFLRALTMSLLRKLDLGTPKVPNLRKMIDNIILELCLPNDIKPLVYSLMHLYRCDFLDVSDKSKERLCTVPDYEGVVMSYVLVAIKLCFGLDGDYEERLSDAVDKINVDRDLQRSHRNGKYTEPSSRLFSFREWCNYLQFRKITLSKCCLYMAEQYCLDIDDQVYIEHTNDRPQKAKDLQDETAMDLINKIPESNEGRVIPKHHFPPTLTPTYDYTDIVVEHSQDPELRYLLSEDFTQYSLKYACEHLELLDENAENIIKGVSENRKVTTNNLIMGTIVMKKSKTKMVYVKNCENKNWMKTKPPTIKHVESEETGNEDVQNSSTDKESDHGYDSENPTSDKDIANEIENGIDITEVSMIEKEKEQDTREFIITEEENEKNIFDDSFEELDLKDEMEQANDEDPDLPYDELQAPHNESMNDDRASITDMSDNENIIPVFNPETFDRDQTIKELVLMACRKYKIPVPSEYRNREPRKRKADVMRDEDINREPRKRTRTSAAENKQKISELVTGYYEHQRFDLFNKLKNEVNMVIRNSSIIGALEPIPNETANITNANVTQPELLNTTNVDVATLSARTSMMTENLENQSAINPQTSVLQTEGDKEQNADKTNEIEEVIDEQTEKKLFEDEEEMNINELLPKVDPKFDDRKYDTEQLYLKMKMEEEIEEDFDMTSLLQDPKVDEILNKKLEEGKTGFFSVAKPENIKTIKTKYESDSDDEVPLKALQEEKKMIEARIAWEEEFEPLINKDNFTEYKYWFRHYDTEFMARSKDWHKKFDEELKENTPSSFYFVIKECATVINSTPFNLYRHMQNLEKFISARAKYLD